MSRRTKSGGRGPTDLELVDEVSRALADPQPLAMLTMASALASALDPSIRTLDPAGPTGQPTAADFVDLLAEEGGIESDALAWVLAHLALDGSPRARILRLIDQTRLPTWMPELADTEVHAAFQTADVLRDTTTISLGARVGGFDLTTVAHLDLNFGAVQDAFTMSVPLSTFAERWTGLAADDASEGAELEVDLAGARAQVEQALVVGRSYWPPFESESWPEEQPLLEFLLRRCPTGGGVMARPVWTDVDSDGVLDGFFATEPGLVLARETDHEMLLVAWLTFASEVGFGDPLLVSGGKLGIFLLGWVGQQWEASNQELALLPTLLRAFVLFAHRQRGVPAAVTSDVLQQLDAISSEFLAKLALGVD